MFKFFKLPLLTLQTHRFASDVAHLARGAILDFGGGRAVDAAFFLILSENIFKNPLQNPEILNFT